MKAIKPILILASVLTLTSSCVFRVDTKRIMNLLSSSETLKASRVYVTKDTTVASFSHLKIRNSVSVSFIQDSTRSSVSIFASDNVMPYIGVNSEEGLLDISLDSEGKLGPFVDWGDVNVVVYAPSVCDVFAAGSSSFSCNHLEISGNFEVGIVGSGEMTFGTLVSDSASLVVTGSGEFEVGTLRSGDVDVQITGSGDVSMKDIAVRSVSACISGSGEFDLSGNADNASYDICGSGEVDAKRLAAKETTVYVSGSGSVIYQDADGKVKTADRSKAERL